MIAAAVDYSVVIPTIGRARLSELLKRIGTGQPAPALIVVADDRPVPDPPLDLAAVPVPLEVVTTRGHGPAAARNAGWSVTDSEWVAFVDDDVEVPADWCAQLARDLSVLGPDIGACAAKIVVPPPPGRRPTDEERRTTALASARWITADMAVRRNALRITGGFDERFPRAFREDSDLALRIIGAGFLIVTGHRVTEHPIRSRGGWFGSVRAQAGNGDNALLRAKFGPHWRRLIGEAPGRVGHHLVATAAAGIAVGTALGHRWRSSAVAVAVWAGMTGEFAARRILPGPRTLGEIATMIATSALIPPVALAHRAAGELRVRLPQRARPIRAVLFDRDGTLIQDVPYLTDPDQVTPVPGAREVVDALRRQGVPVGVVSNQSGIARGLITPEQLAAVNRRVDLLLGPFDTWQVCIHGPDDDCRCRKPRPQLVLDAAAELDVNPAECLVVGDIGTDVDAALCAGAHAVLVPTPITAPEEITRARELARVAGSLWEAVDVVLAGAR